MKERTTYMYGPAIQQQQSISFRRSIGPKLGRVHGAKILEKQKFKFFNFSQKIFINYLNTSKSVAGRHLYGLTKVQQLLRNPTTTTITKTLNSNKLE
jgi:hypothetical protein